jgi:hypothetical protein
LVICNSNIKLLINPTTLPIIAPILVEEDGGRSCEKVTSFVILGEFEPLQV